jgi:hypothetical protein
LWDDGESALEKEWNKEQNSMKKNTGNVFL